MYCQSCGIQNPEDARYCKACGTMIAAPGEKGGPVLDDTVTAMDTLPAGPSQAATQPSQPSTGTATLPPRLSAAAAAGSTGAISRMSISLAEMGIRSPRRTGMIVLAIAAGLVAVGAGTMLIVMRLVQPEPAMVSAVPEPASQPARMSIGFPELEGLEGQDAPGTTPARRRNARPPADKASPGGVTDTPESPGTTAPGGTETPVGKAPGQPGRGPDEPPRSSSTKVEAPPEPSGGEASGPGAGEGTGAGAGAGEDPFDDPASIPGGMVEDSRDLEMDSYAGDVRSVIRRFYAPRARNCYDRATRNNPGLRGTVIVRFTIRPDGQVGQASIADNSTGDDTLGRCIAGQVSTWRLPPPPDDRPLTFEMPFSW
jgi:TonB family protein